MSEKEKTIDSLRFLSMATEKLYDHQVMSLKCIPLVLFGETLSNEVKVDFDKKKINFILKGNVDCKKQEIDSKFEYLCEYVKRLVGRDYIISMSLNKREFDGRRKPDSSSDRKVNPRRKKSLRKTRKRKQAKSVT